MQTWNSVCGADGNPNNRKLEGSGQLVPRCTSLAVAHTSRASLQVAFAILFVRASPLKGGELGRGEDQP